MGKGVGEWRRSKPIRPQTPHGFAGQYLWEGDGLDTAATVIIWCMVLIVIYYCLRTVFDSGHISICWLIGLCIVGKTLKGKLSGAGICLIVVGAPGVVITQSLYLLFLLFTYSYKTYLLGCFWSSVSSNTPDALGITVIINCCVFH